MSTLIAALPDKFTAFRIHQVKECDKKKITSGFDKISINDLTDGEVVIKVAYSDINYKDALGRSSAGPAVGLSVHTNYRLATVAG